MAYQAGPNVLFPQHRGASSIFQEDIIMILTSAQMWTTLSEIQRYNHIRKVIAPPNTVCFNYFSLLHIEVSKCLVVMLTRTQ